MYADKLDERGVRYLNHVRGAAQDMSQLIDALLQLTRVTRGERREEEVDLSALAHAVVAELRAGDPTRSVEFAIDDGVVVSGDPRLLRAVLENLVGNAWKFTRDQDQAHIDFGVIQDDDKPVYFVRDNGAGFDMDYAKKLFAPFQRLHAPSDFEGTGIGLATVQRIIHHHGGRIWAQGAVDQGASFHFTLLSENEEAA